MRKSPDFIVKTDDPAALMPLMNELHGIKINRDYESGAHRVHPVSKSASEGGEVRKALDELGIPYEEEADPHFSPDMVQ